MHLDEYLKVEKARSRLTETDFGASVGLSQPQVNRIRQPGAKTSWDTAVRINKETGGKITMADLGFALEAAE